jgi:hypothetical protein
VGRLAPGYHVGEVVAGFTVWESWLTLFLDHAGLTLDDLYKLYPSRLHRKVVPKICRWVNRKSLDSKLYAAGGTLVDAFWRILVGNYLQTDIDSHTKAQAKDEQAFWRAWKNCIIGDGDKEDYRPRQGVIVHDMLVMTFCRRFFITKEGYLGLGPRKMQSGTRSTLWLVGIALWFSVRLLTNDQFSQRIQLTHLWGTATSMG